MIEGLRPYPDVAATEVGWLHHLPTHWQVNRAKYVFREVDCRSVDGVETHLSMHQKLGLVPSASTGEKRLVSESYAGGKLVEPNDLVLNRLKAHLGVFAYASQPGVISPDYTVLRPLPNSVVRYYEYLLKSPACRGELRTRTKGIVEGFWRLYTDDFYNIRLPVPPLDEQRLIVRFLDWHGAMTGKLIRAKRRLIALLNEQKQSIINRAVTRGLDPSAKLKPSGVDWLGDVPEHWEVRKVREVARVVNGYPFDAELFTHGAGFPLIRIRDLNKAETAVRYAGDFIEAAAIAPGETLIGMDGDFNVGTWMGNETALLNQRMCCVRANDPTLNPFIRLALARPLKEINAVTWSTTVKHLASGQVERIQLAIPPADEVEQIILRLRDELTGVDAIESAIRRELELVQEFRTRLIADVVTGQLDVRAIAASLPDVADAEAADLTNEDDLDDDADDLIDEEEAA